jgi:1-acyl-sn-glycerol-3-phosphate acyltransferase
MKKLSLLQKIKYFISACIFALILFGTVIPYSFLCLIALIFPLRVRYAMVMAWNRLLIWSLRVFCGINYHLEGAENIPKDRNGVVLSKHQSAWETFFLPEFFHQAAIIVKQELMWIPFFGWGLLSIEPIAINRKEKSSAMEQILKKGKNALDQGRWVLMFPEGTRIAPGNTGNYRQGGARLATHTGYPIIPVAHNAGHYWPRRGFLKRPGTVHVVIGPLIETKNRSADEVLAEAKNWIETTMKRIDNASH